MGVYHRVAFAGKLSKYEELDEVDLTATVAERVLFVLRADSATTRMAHEVSPRFVTAS